MPYLIPLTQMSLAASCYSMVALTVERYISVCHPFFKQRHNVKAWVFLVPVGLFVLLYSSPRFFEMRIMFACETNATATAIESANYTTNATSIVVDTEPNCDFYYPYVDFNGIRTEPLYVTVS